MTTEPSMNLPSLDDLTVSVLRRIRALRTGPQVGPPAGLNTFVRDFWVKGAWASSRGRRWWLADVAREVAALERAPSVYDLAPYQLVLGLAERALMDPNYWPLPPEPFWAAKLVLQAGARLVAGELEVEARPVSVEALADGYLHEALLLLSEWLQAVVSAAPTGTSITRARLGQPQQLRFERQP